MSERVGGGASSEPRTWDLRCDRFTGWHTHAKGPALKPGQVVRVVEQQSGTERVEPNHARFHVPESPEHQPDDEVVAALREADERVESAGKHLSRADRVMGHAEDSKAFQAGVAAVVEVLREADVHGRVAPMNWREAFAQAAEHIESHPRFKAAARDGTGGQGA